MKITGLPAGPKIGTLKSKLLELQIDGDLKTPTEAQQWLSKKK